MFTIKKIIAIIGLSMKKDKELLLIFPPQWTPISPHYAICALLGQLKENGYNASFMDLNVEFYNHILKIDYLKNINEKIMLSSLPR